MPDTSTDVVGARTPAGWSFVPEPGPGVSVSPDAFVVEIAVGPGGFRLDGRPAPVSAVARLIAAVGGTTADRLLVVPHGPVPPGPAADLLFGTLATALGVPVTLAGPSTVDRVGRVDPVRINGAHGHLLDAARWSHPWDIVGLPAVTMLETETETAPDPATGGPVWIDGRDWSADDRARLRRAVHGRFDTHARTVERTVAEEPGLRGRANAGDAHTDAVTDLVTDLVALRVCAVDERDRVNDTLRTGAGSDALLARGAVAGLARLPAVLGPVFATGPSGVSADAYRPGTELVEPAFLDVDLNPTAARDGIAFAIWSVGARRLGGLCPDRPTAAMFAPGSRFVVLAVDGDRVLLAERPAGRASGRAADRAVDRAADRLRAALARPAGSAPAPAPVRPLTFAPGLDAHDVPFTTAPHAHGGL